jgi:hypothetical protein
MVPTVASRMCDGAGQGKNAWQRITADASGSTERVAHAPGDQRTNVAGRHSLFGTMISRDSTTITAPGVLGA